MRAIDKSTPNRFIKNVLFIPSIAALNIFIFHPIKGILENISIPKKAVKANFIDLTLNKIHKKPAPNNPNNKLRIFFYNISIFFFLSSYRIY